MYLRPGTLSEACEALAAHPLRILAGGTDVFPSLGDGPAPSAVLDITGLAELDGVDARRRRGSGSAPGRPGPGSAPAELPARLRRPEAGRPRGRLRPDPERRDDRRQPLQRLARRRRRAAAPLPRRRGRARERDRPAPPAARRVPARRTAAPTRRPDEILTAIIVPRGRGRGALRLRQARGPALPRHLDRHGRGRPRAGRDGPRRGGRGRGRLVLGRRAAACRRLEARARRAAARTGSRPSAVAAATISRRSSPIDDVRGHRRLPARRGARRSSAGRSTLAAERAREARGQADRLHCSTARRSRAASAPAARLTARAARRARPRRAPRSAATPAIAAPARCSSTASRSAAASSPAGRRTGAASRPSRA